MGGSWGLPAGYEGKHARRDVPHFLHEPFQLTVVLDPLPVKDEFVFGEVQADGLSAGLARPVVVGAVTGVRVVVAATGGPPTRYPAGLNAALADEPERLQFRLERVVFAPGTGVSLRRCRSSIRCLTSCLSVNIQ